MLTCIWNLLWFILFQVINGILANSLTLDFFKPVPLESPASKNARSSTTEKKLGFNSSSVQTPAPFGPVHFLPPLSLCLLFRIDELETNCTPRLRVGAAENFLDWRPLGKCRQTHLQAPGESIRAEKLIHTEKASGNICSRDDHVFRLSPVGWWLAHHGINSLSNQPSSHSRRKG